VSCRAGELEVKLDKGASISYMVLATSAQHCTLPIGAFTYDVLPLSRGILVASLPSCLLWETRWSLGYPPLPSIFLRKSSVRFASGRLAGAPHACCTSHQKWVLRHREQCRTSKSGDLSLLHESLCYVHVVFRTHAPARPYVAHLPHDRCAQPI
jgi:hypothetical protein